MLAACQRSGAGRMRSLTSWAATWRRLRPVARRAWAQAMAVGLSRVSLRGLLQASCSEAERSGLAFKPSRSRCGRGSCVAAPSFCRRGRGCARGRAVGRSFGCQGPAGTGVQMRRMAACSQGAGSVVCGRWRRGPWSVPAVAGASGRTPRRLSSFMASWVRSLIASRSHWATDISTFSSSLPPPSGCRWRRSPTAANGAGPRGSRCRGGCPDP